MTEGLQTLNLSLFDTPTQQPVAEDPQPVEPDYTVHIKSTRAGVDILVCSKHPAPPEVIAEAHGRGMALFTFDEIPHLAGADQEMIEAILAIKTVFQGCHVLDVINQVAA